MAFEFEFEFVSNFVTVDSNDMYLNLSLDSNRIADLKSSLKSR